MWKALILVGKMCRSTFQYNCLTLTYSIFHVNHNTFRSFLSFYINIFRHSTQLWSLIIPTKRHFNTTESSLLFYYFYVHIGLFQLALRAI